MKIISSLSLFAVLSSIAFSLNANEPQSLEGKTYARNSGRMVGTPPNHRWQQASLEFGENWKVIDTNPARAGEASEQCDYAISELGSELIVDIDCPTSAVQYFLSNDKTTLTKVQGAIYRLVEN